jgi:hypothetical protein
MERFQFRRILPVFLLVLFNCAFVAAQSGNKPLTNAAIVKLVKAGFKEKSIIAIIGSKPVSFDLSTDRMIELKRTGVTEKIILAMIARQEGEEFSDESLSDEEFFRSATGKPTAGSDQPANPADGNTTDIFGARGGSKGSTKTRGGNGSSSGDILTTGSATVRILRPPTEAGGAGPKLEKTPSLNNNSIIELVEAGFSEGTIIRRIEQSPVNFDLSGDKLADLRKHRVSEKIVVAMKTAMGVDSSSSTTPSPNVIPKQ